MAKPASLAIVEKERVLRCFWPYGRMVEKMETLKVQLQKEKAQRVREIAMRRFGFSKGAITKGMQEALDDWMKKNQEKANPVVPDWSDIRGALKDIKMTSVELQHKAFLLRDWKQHSYKKN